MARDRGFGGKMVGNGRPLNVRNNGSASQSGFSSGTSPSLVRPSSATASTAFQQSTTGKQRSSRGLVMFASPNKTYQKQRQHYPAHSATNPQLIFGENITGLAAADHRNQFTPTNPKPIRGGRSGGGPVVRIGKKNVVAVSHAEASRRNSQMQPQIGQAIPGGFGGRADFRGQSSFSIGSEVVDRLEAHLSLDAFGASAVEPALRSAARPVVRPVYSDPPAQPLFHVGAAGSVPVHADLDLESVLLFSENLEVLTRNHRQGTLAPVGQSPHPVETSHPNLPPSAMQTVDPPLVSATSDPATPTPVAMGSGAVPGQLGENAVDCNSFANRATPAAAARGPTARLFGDFSPDQFDVANAVEDIKRAEFVGIDLEFSGLYCTRRENDLEGYYRSCVANVKQFACLQLGLCVGYRDPSKGDQWILAPYNFYCFPDQRALHLFATDTLRWLRDQGFDFNRWVDDGCDFAPLGALQMSEQRLGGDPPEADSPQRAPDANGLPRRLSSTGSAASQTSRPPLQAPRGFVEPSRMKRVKEFGLQRIIEAIIEHEVPLVLHNGVFDLLHLCHKFIGAMPDSLKEFCIEMQRLFSGGIYDTKFVAGGEAFAELDLRSSKSRGLMSLRRELMSVSTFSRFEIAQHRVEFCKQHNYSVESGETDGPLHEAGFDALATAQVFILENEILFRADSKAMAVGAADPAEMGGACLLDLLRGAQTTAAANAVEESKDMPTHAENPASEEPNLETAVPELHRPSLLAISPLTVAPNCTAGKRDVSPISAAAMAEGVASLGLDSRAAGTEASVVVSPDSCKRRRMTGEVSGTGSVVCGGSTTPSSCKEAPLQNEEGELESKKSLVADKPTVLGNFPQHDGFSVSLDGGWKPPHEPAIPLAWSQYSACLQNRNVLEIPVPPRSLDIDAIASLFDSLEHAPMGGSYHPTDSVRSK